MIDKLHVAIKHGNLAEVKLLLDIGADVNGRNKRRLMPLHVAIDGNHTEIVILLLAKGADVNGRDNDGETPLHIALFRPS